MAKIEDLKSFRVRGAKVRVERVTYSGRKKKTYKFTFRADNGDFGHYTTDASNLENAKEEMKGYFGF